MPSELGRLFLIVGGLLVLLGLVLIFLPSLRLGRLPGDLIFRKGNWTVYLPLMSGVVVSIILSLVVWLVLFFRK